MTDIRILPRRAEEYLAQLLTLAQEIEAHDGHRALEDHRWIDLTGSAGEPTLGLLAIDAASRSVVGYLRLSSSRKGVEFELLVKPDFRRPIPAVAKMLLEAGLREVDPASRVSIWVPNPEASQELALVGAGFTPDREVVQLRMPLPASIPETAPNLQLRPFQVGKDEMEWLELNNRAFMWHPDQGDWDLATLEERETEPWFDPVGFLILETDGVMRGFCWTKVHEGSEPRMGEIYVIAVDPDLVGSGTGRGLLAAGLDHLANARGVTTAMLYVESSNVRARKLYDSFGFRADHLDRRYVRQGRDTSADNQ